jgi:glycine cleavage system H protein
MTEESAALRFAKSHEWARLENDIATIGISDHAQEELGDVALVLLPEVGRMLQAGEKFGEVESIKAVSDLYSPLAGRVVEVNEVLLDSPEQVNDDPYGEGWMVRIQVSDLAEVGSLMGPDEYDHYLGEL